MKKELKIIIIIIGALISIILLDSLQAKIFNNKPIIGIETKCRMKKGILVSTYYCVNGKKTIFNFENYPFCATDITCKE